jgi:hypothetical protein
MSTATTVPRTFPPKSAPARPTLSAAEQERRASHVASANGHSAMEGQFGSPLLDSLQERYVAGELTIEQSIAEAKRQYGID